MKFIIYTFGCKVNQYESQMMKEKLLSANFLATDNLDEADIYIINTCTVTNTADHKCLKFLKRIQKKYPTKISVVTGCSVQNNPDLYRNININILLGNKQKSQIATILKKYLDDLKPYDYVDLKRDLTFEDMEIKNFDRARAFIKIEDGCDNFCTYCIIPYVRGSVRSKDFDLIIEEAKCLAQNHQEIILTGIHTGHYENNGHDLSDLIMALSEIPNLQRIRISSIEITELNAKFLNVLKTCPKLVDHLHIPLQAGSDKILKLMHRKYDLAYFGEKIKEIRAIRPNISLSTDVIVGFPQESDADFAQTCQTCQDFAFSKIHVFPYSPRKGTVASTMEGQIPDEVKKMRVHQLMAISSELEKKYRQKFKGQELDCLIEKVVDGKSYGHTGNYLEVELDEALEVGKIYSRIL